MSPTQLKVDYLTRVEGEGGIEVILDEDRRVQEVRVRIFEPPRFFEGIMKGRRCEEVADIAARICGICPVSYQLCTLQAIERILNIKLSTQVRLLRKVFALSQWIQSHSLHVFFLALPDYLGCDNIFQMAAEHRDLVERALRLKKLGNDITRAMGGREVHPISAVLGGFTKLPSETVLRALASELRSGLEDAWASFEFIAGLSRPPWNGERLYGALSSPGDYAVTEGKWRTSTGLCLDPQEFPQYIEEFQVHYSNALRCRFKDGSSYMVGPLARVNLNFEQLSPEASRAASRYNIKPPQYNPYDSLVARALEIIHAIQASLECLEGMPNEKQESSYQIKAGEGASIVEAPRGSLFTRYNIDAGGFVKEARIIAPTTQNLFRIEQDIKELLPGIVHKSEGEITRACEVAVRNYDPCISCATHCIIIHGRALKDVRKPPGRGPEGPAVNG